MAVHQGRRSSKVSLSPKRSFCVSIFGQLARGALLQKEAQARCNLLVKLCNHLGFLINFQKSDLKPTQIFNFVGIHFNVCLLRAFITQKNVNKVLSATQQMSQVQQASAQKWQSLISTLQAQATLIYLGRFKVRSVQFHLSSHWNQARDPPKQLIPLSPKIKDILLWWQTQENLTQGISFESPAFTHSPFH